MKHFKGKNLRDKSIFGEEEQQFCSLKHTMLSSSLGSLDKYNLCSRVNQVGLVIRRSQVQLGIFCPHICIRLYLPIPRQYCGRNHKVRDNKQNNITRYNFLSLLKQRQLFYYSYQRFKVDDLTDLYGLISQLGLGFVTDSFSNRTE